MPAQILAVGTTAADSADVVVAAGTPLTVALKDAAGPVVGVSNDLSAPALVQMKLKDDAGQYFLIDTLNSKSRPAIVIFGPGTYQFSRIAGTSCGVFSG
ncbi:MAG: hypothetical protein ABJA10_07645 [Aestuariivirga sp.]